MRVSDHGAQKDRLLDERRRDAERRAQAIAELVAVGDRLAEVRLSAPAMLLVLELLGLATARFGPDLAGATAALVDAPLTLWIEPNDGSTHAAQPGRRPHRPRLPHRRHVDGRRPDWLDDGRAATR